MMRIVPTPARASKEASADPVAPQPTMAMRDPVSLRWPSTPTPGKSTCREYLSSCSKEVISSTLTNHYDGCHAVCKPQLRLQAVATSRLSKHRKRTMLWLGLKYNIVLRAFIEPDIG